MKSALKRVFSLMLVAMLLVTAIPFQASAAEGGKVTVVLKQGDDVVNTQVIDSVKEFPTTANKLIKYKLDLSGVTGSLVKIAREGGAEIDGDTELNDGDLIYLRYEDNTTPTPDPDPAPAEDKNITLKLLFNDDSNVSKTITREPKSGSATIADMLTYWYDANWSDNYDFYRANNGRIGTVYEKDTVIYAGESVNVRLKAKTQEVAKINIVVKVNNSDNVVWEGSKAPSNGEYSLVSNLLTYCWNGDWDNTYTFDHAWSHEQGKNVAKDGKIYAGDTVYIMVNRGADIDEPAAKDTVVVKILLNNNSYVSYTRTYKGTAGKTASIRTILNQIASNWDDDYKFVRADVNGKNDVTDIDTKVSMGQTIYVRLQSRNGSTGSRFKYDVILHIYDQYGLKPMRTINLTEKGYSFAENDTIYLNDIKGVVKKYYTAKNSDGIDYGDGIYFTTGDTLTDYVKGELGSTKVTGVDDLRREGYLHLNVWIGNYKAASSSSSSTNPKTGDSVVMTVTTLGITASALAAAYYVSKKRMSK